MVRKHESGSAKRNKRRKIEKMIQTQKELLISFLKLVLQLKIQLMIYSMKGL
ncbi:unnamed protein product, partial [Prunus brigantina]